MTCFYRSYTKVVNDGILILSNNPGFHGNHLLHRFYRNSFLKFKFSRLFNKKAYFALKMAAQIKCNATQTSIAQDPQKETTKEFYATCNLPARWDRPYWFNGYGSQQVPLPNPCYRSTYADYGWYPPNIHTVPVSYHPTQQRFTHHLGICGMYRNSSLNTCLDPKRPGE